MTVNNIPWYKSFFTSDYPELYGFHLRTKQTKRQIRFVRKALDLQAGETVLDLCCGQGRHSIALAKKGLNIIGLDLNRDYLAWAERAAAEAGVEIETIEADMREIPFSERFDAVISMFSSFGYLESDDEDLRVLEAIRQALKPAGRLLLDLPNQEWSLRSDGSEQRHQNSDGSVTHWQSELDLETGRNRVTFSVVGPDGENRNLGSHIIRQYTLAEFIANLREAGLEYVSASGDYEGHPFSPTAERMLITARRPA